MILKKLAYDVRNQNSDCLWGEWQRNWLERKIYGLMQILFILNLVMFIYIANIELCIYDLCILLYAPHASTNTISIKTSKADK